MGQVMGRLKFKCSAGALVRGRVRGSIEAYCFENDLKVEVFENKGFFESEYSFKITGTQEQIEKAQLDLGHLFKHLSEE